MLASACAHRTDTVIRPERRDPLRLSAQHFPSGAPYALSDDLGHVVLLDVWATWCEVCVESLPAFAELLGQYGPRGFRAYAMSVDEDPAMVELFVKTLGLKLPVLLDLGARVAEGQLGIDRLPTTFLLDRHGVVRFVHQGFGPGVLEGYRQEIETLLAEEGR